MPCPGAFVVKKGSKILSMFSAAMPLPSSVIVVITCSPSSRDSMRISPPSREASRALLSRFTKTCSSFWPSASTKWVGAHRLR
ncbi:hypothetical protein D3C83_153920 [compost metagenome]